jgi:hypothetical protein
VAILIICEYSQYPNRFSTAAWPLALVLLFLAFWTHFLFAISGNSDNMRMFAYVDKKRTDYGTI